MRGTAEAQGLFWDTDVLCEELIEEEGFLATLRRARSTVFTDSDFDRLYPSGRGRPSHPPSVLAALLLAQLFYGVSDREAERRSRLDLSWKAALGLPLNHRGIPHVCLAEFRARLLRAGMEGFLLPIPDKELESGEPPYYNPGTDSEEIQYMLARRHALGGVIPERRFARKGIGTPKKDVWETFAEGSKLPVSTTMAFVRLLRDLMRDQTVGKRIVPIIPDEARTFGMESLFPQFKIYAAHGQLYEPVDAAHLLAYVEAQDGQILEEGITEAGSMASFTAAGTSYASHEEPMVPFFTFYSMFGFQRIGDLIWAAGDQRARGFLLGATHGRTTLNGEGLQHQDGHSLLLASTNPACMAYDPAFAYEVAAIVKDGLKRMYQDHRDVIYYMALYNENYPMPPMPEGVEEGILRGLYPFKAGPEVKNGHRAQLLGSGSVMQQALRAQELLAEFDVSADVWSATSYQQLRAEALEVERWNRLHPNEARRVPYVTKQLEPVGAPVVA